MYLTQAKLGLQANKQSADIFVWSAKAVIDSIFSYKFARVLTAYVVLHNALADNHIPKQDLVVGPKARHSTTNAIQQGQLKPQIDGFKTSRFSRHADLAYIEEKYENNSVSFNPT
ncbi:uncharacterized protein ColSpa_03215 [Colletotrichum spaethianum]|uniref:Uncharacterized protein n=1 Tax=Colletotrichum spaethianum TaxID=700344 RepID=A0AA37LAI0_9PEZI|nr:uncharacterized protein ColSpa_03215 [Colletotrichum spaethianum]GKT43034.1 hypothetical protein ColSpa_03215 [Colletotrichum spaethianum]